MRSWNAGTVELRGLLGGRSVPAGLYEVMRGQDLLLLLDEKFADGQGEIVFESFCVGFLGFVLALFRGLEEAVIVGTELGFEVAPGAVDGAGHGAGLLYVGHAGAVEFVLELSAEVGALEAFGEEVALEGDVLEVVADIGKAFLAVLESLDEVEENSLHLFILGRSVSVLVDINSFLANGHGDARAGSADWMRFSFIGSKREKSRKSRSPTARCLRFKFGKRSPTPTYH